MKKIILAFILSILIHILFFYTYKTPTETKPYAKKQELTKDKKSSITYVKIKQKPLNKPKEKIKEQKVKKVVKKKPKKREVIKKRIIPKEKKVKKLNLPKEKKITKTFKKVKEPITKQKKRKSIKDKSLENFFLSKPVLDTQLLDELTQSYIKLYGDEFNKFTKVQKVFLQKNLKTIGTITQRYLLQRGYPRISIRTKQQGMNIIEFYLYPNGDISTLKITSTSGYSALDNNTIETIKTAYKDYPRPKSKTKIKIYVHYRLY